LLYYAYLIAPISNIQPGDIVLFSWKGDENPGNRDHTAIVKSVEKDDEGKLQATFKVTDIGINIDKSKINTTTTNDEEQMPDNVMTQEATNTTGTNTTTANTTTTEGTTAEWK